MSDGIQYSRKKCCTSQCREGGKERQLQEVFWFDLETLMIGGIIDEIFVDVFVVYDGVRVEGLETVVLL